MRTKKAMYNIISQMSYEIIAMVCGLILPRFILASFGSSYNGMVSSITQFLDYISILTLGISGSTRVAIYKANAKDDLRGISAILKATELYMRKVAYIFVAYMLLLVFLYPYIVRSEFEWLDAASLVIIIGLGTFAEYFFGITYRTFLAASQSMYIYNIIQIFAKIANTVISVVLILCGQSIQVVKLGSAICFVASPLILNYIVRKKYNIIKNVKPDNSALKQRGDVMAHSIANIVHQYTDIFLLTLFTDTKTVSIYAVYSLVLGSLRKLQNVFTSGLEAAFGDIWARGEVDRFSKNLNIFEYFIYAFCAIVFTCAGILILPFVKLYTSDIVDVNYILPVFAILSVITYAMFCLRAPYLVAVQAAGRYKETKKGAFVEAGINFFISIVGVMKFGIIGVTMGTLAANSFRTIQYATYISFNMLDRSITIVLKKLLWLICTVLIIAGAYICTPDIIIINSWAKWCLSGLLWFVISFIFTCVMSFVFYKGEFFDSIELVKKMFTKKIKKGKNS